jgi:Fibronectin type III domain
MTFSSRMDYHHRNHQNSLFVVLFHEKHIGTLISWPTLKLATAKLRSLDIYRNGERLSAVPSPMTNTSTKHSGMEIKTEYSFQLVLRTTAGTFPSNILRVRAHTMSDTSGISVCSGNVQDSVLSGNAKMALRDMGAKWGDNDTQKPLLTRSNSSNVSSPLLLPPSLLLVQIQTLFLLHHIPMLEDPMSSHFLIIFIIKVPMVSESTARPSRQPPHHRSPQTTDHHHHPTRLKTRQDSHRSTTTTTTTFNIPHQRRTRAAWKYYSTTTTLMTCF